VVVDVVVVVSVNETFGVYVAVSGSVAVSLS